MTNLPIILSCIYYFCISEQSNGVHSVGKQTTVWIKHLEYEKRPFSLKRICLHNTYVPLGWYLIASWMTATFIPMYLPTMPLKLCTLARVKVPCFICSETLPSAYTLISTVFMVISVLKDVDFIDTVMI